MFLFLSLASRFRATSSSFLQLEKAIRDAKSFTKPDSPWISAAEVALHTLVADERWLRAAAEPLDIAVGHTELMRRMVVALNGLANDWAQDWASERMASFYAQRNATVREVRGRRPWGQEEQRLAAQLKITPEDAGTVPVDREDARVRLVPEDFATQYSMSARTAIGGLLATLRQRHMGNPAPSVPEDPALRPRSPSDVMKKQQARAA